MALETRIVGGRVKTAAITEAHVHPFETITGNHSGLVVLTKNLQDFTPTIVPFLNTAFGNKMNQAVTFTGTPELITDGGSGGTEWAGTANQGTWNFADSGKTTITAALNNDNATFDDAGTIDMSVHTAITGLVDLDVYSPTQNTIVIQFGLSGSLVGNSVNLDDFIDTSNFSEQGFVIPKGDLGITSATVDEMTITILRSGGTKPTIKFDDIQIEELGEPAVFKSFAVESNFHVKRISFLLADNVSSIVTGSTTTYPTMPGLSYDKILGLASLTIGITIQIVVNGAVQTAVNIKQLSDFIGAGGNIISAISDGTNTLISLELELSDPIILKRGQVTTDFVSVTINDDLSGLLLFTGSLRGSYES